MVAEINTRKADDPEERESDLLETLAYTRLHFAAPETSRGGSAGH